MEFLKDKEWLLKNSSDVVNFVLPKIKFSKWR